MKLKRAVRKTTSESRTGRADGFIISPWSVEKIGVSVIFGCTTNA
jgi:hypothetical protein